MSLVPTFLHAIVQAAGEALVMHVGEKPYVVTPEGKIALGNGPLSLEAVAGVVAELLAADAQQTLRDEGAVQYDLPPQPGHPGEHFTVVVARTGDDIWAEIRCRTTGERHRQPSSPSLSPSPSPSPADQVELASIGRSLEQVVDTTAGTATKLDELASRVVQLEDRLKGFEDRGDLAKGQRESMAMLQAVLKELETIRAEVRDLHRGQKESPPRPPVSKTAERALPPGDAADTMKQWIDRLYSSPQKA